MKHWTGMNDLDFRNYFAQLKRDVASVADKAAHVERSLKGDGREHTNEPIYQRLVSIRNFLRALLTEVEQEASRRAAAAGGRAA